MTDKTNTTPNGKTIPEYAQMAGESLRTRAKHLLRESNARHVIVRNRSGKKLFEVQMTAAVIAVVLVSLVALWFTVAVAVIGYLAKIQVEIVGEVNHPATRQDTVEMVEL